MTKRPVHRKTHRTIQRHVEHQVATDIQKKELFSRHTICDQLSEEIMVVGICISWIDLDISLDNLRPTTCKLCIQ